MQIYACPAICMCTDDNNYFLFRKYKIKFFITLPLIKIAMHHIIDIFENNILQKTPEILLTLLKDHTTSRANTVCNIFWATSDYERLGKGYGYHDPILPELITGENSQVIMPRILKHKNTQSARVRDMAEVFTPAWVCNAQNNLIDEAWFGRKDVFNTEYMSEDGTHSWKTNPERISFPEGKTWKDYVRDTRLEITCGEAPYIVSRYDATTGTVIPLTDRIGLLDRKLRVVSENTETSGEWLEAAQEAYKSIYAYEWQGDSLLIARESMLASFMEYYRAKFGKDPLAKSVNYIAYIISWNVWQMDGLKGVVPDSCHDSVHTEVSLFGDSNEVIIPCEGCRTNNIFRHNGTYCLIKDWHAKDPQTGHKGKRIRYIDLLK